MESKKESGVETTTILVTGGAGFIGSNFIAYMLGKYSYYEIVNLDALTYAGNLENLRAVENNPRYSFVKGDIRDRKLIDSLFLKYGFTYVVNFAAESHVDRSIEDPELFLTTNIIGTEVLLDVAKKYWKIHPQDKYSKEYQYGVRFHQVSTDEVYGALGKDGLFVETMPLSPNSPYSASKASADMIVRAYHETFGLPVTITRCSNNYGSFQFPEKLIPLMINNSVNNKALPVYGDGMQIRDWLHVADHCSAIDVVLHKGTDGEIYNVGGNNEKANIEIVKLILRATGKTEDLITHVKDRLGHDRRYAIDNTKITTQLGWKPSYTFEEGMQETIQWYLANSKWIENVVSGDYQGYYEKMYRMIGTNER
jgi:dTDP-glucose 4,6-dehydratase